MVIPTWRHLFILALASCVAFATQINAEKIKLSQKEVAELVLKQGPATEDVNDTYIKARFEPAKAQLDYDWTATLESGVENDKSESLEKSRPVGSSNQTWTNLLSLKKSFTTGSKFTVLYRQDSRNTAGSLTTGSTPVESDKVSYSEFGILIEQSLLKNAFGIGDRAKMESARSNFAAATVERVDSLENVVLKVIEQYWNAYVAEETFRQALAARERFIDLVKQVKRKNSVGYANPGELAQVQADYEAQEQAIKTASTTYLAQMDTLLTSLNLPQGTEIEFAVSDKIPPVPKLNAIQVGKMRSIRATELQLEGAQAELRSAKNKQLPTIDLVGKYYTTGHSDTSDGAFSRASSTTHPKYYLGAKLSYTFGSDFQTEDVINKKAIRDLKETSLNLQRRNSTNKLAQDERTVEATYAIVQSAMKQKEYRERAVKELTRTYSQGRTDIKTLIDAINNQFNTEIKLSRAIGDYQIALNTWAATRDELIPDSLDKPDNSGGN